MDTRGQFCETHRRPIGQCDLIDPSCLVCGCGGLCDSTEPCPMRRKPDRRVDAGTLQRIEQDAQVTLALAGVPVSGDESIVDDEDLEPFGYHFQGFLNE